MRYEVKEYNSAKTQAFRVVDTKGIKRFLTIYADKRFAEKVCHKYNIGQQKLDNAFKDAPDDIRVSMLKFGIIADV